ncbi:hypothetical protein TIFTF001_005517 [Ficus carica]|uniref:DUF1985 domain-containing protein n=1 Tax=Ficus carica TaxID=3494 RepID=A0AA88CZG8_FICCA|nr:hypothetical protein TIFTF001_005517 [Ficus carica]
MSKPTKLAEKNITPEKRPFRVMASAYKRPPAKKSSKKPAPESEKRVAEEGLKIKHGEIEVKESKKPKSVVEEKISEVEYEGVIHQPCIQQFLKLNTLGWAGHVFHNIIMRLTDHLRMSDALWFEVGEDLGRFSNDEFCLIIGMKCVGSTRGGNTGHDTTTRIENDTNFAGSDWEK